MERKLGGLFAHCILLDKNSASDTSLHLKQRMCRKKLNPIQTTEEYQYACLKP